MCFRYSTVVRTDVTALLCCHLHDSSTLLVWDDSTCSGMPEFAGGVKGEMAVMVRTEGHCKLCGSATLQWSERM